MNLQLVYVHRNRTADVQWFTRPVLFFELKGRDLSHRIFNITCSNMTRKFVVGDIRESVIMVIQSMGSADLVKEES